MAKSKYLAKKLLDHSLGVAAFAKPAAVYLALFTSTAGLDDGTLTNEVQAGGYARKPVSFAAAADYLTGGKSLNSAQVNFDVAAADWNSMVGWAVMDALTGGNVLHWGEFPKYGAPADYKRVCAGDGFFVLQGDIVLSEV